jgi:ABC-type dipeptide/oligopeptide/nickel transport system permease component
MFQYLLRRLVISVPVLLIVSLLVFLSLHIAPGDPILLLLGPETAISAEVLDSLRDQHGLNDPLWLQYARFLNGLSRGDLGRSIRTGRPVSEHITEALPSTVELTLASMFVAMVLGLPLGMLAAMFRNGIIDRFAMGFAVATISLPSFWFGLMLIFFFSLWLGWLPATGQGGIQRLLMPSIALGASSAAIIARLTRSGLVEILGDDFVRTARAKGLPEHRVIVGHALRNALIPVVTVSGLQFGALLSGAVIIETVFSRPGLGQLTVNAILNRDFPIVQGTILLFAALYLILNLLVDVLYGVLDPRIRYAS